MYLLNELFAGCEDLRVLHHQPKQGYQQRRRDAGQQTQEGEGNIIMEFFIRV